MSWFTIFLILWAVLFVVLFCARVKLVVDRQRRMARRCRH